MHLSRDFVHSLRFRLWFRPLPAPVNHVAVLPNRALLSLQPFPLSPTVSCSWSLSVSNVFDAPKCCCALSVLTPRTSHASLGRHFRFGPTLYTPRRAVLFLQPPLPNRAVLSPTAFFSSQPRCSLSNRLLLSLLVPNKRCGQCSWRRVRRTRGRCEFSHFSVTVCSASLVDPSGRRPPVCAARRA